MFLLVKGGFFQRKSIFNSETNLLHEEESKIDRVAELEELKTHDCCR